MYNEEGRDAENEKAYLRTRIEKAMVVILECSKRLGNLAYFPMFSLRRMKNEFFETDYIIHLFHFFLLL